MRSIALLISQSPFSWSCPPPPSEKLLFHSLPIKIWQDKSAAKRAVCKPLPLKRKDLVTSKQRPTVLQPPSASQTFKLWDNSYRMGMSGRKSYISNKNNIYLETNDLLSLYHFSYTNCRIIFLVLTEYWTNYKLLSFWLMHAKIPLQSRFNLPFRKCFTEPSCCLIFQKTVPWGFLQFSKEITD